MATSFRAPAAADLSDAAGQSCPYCQQSIPNERAEEIRARFELSERQQEAALQARMNEQLVIMREQMEAMKTAEILQIQTEKVAFVEKLNADAVAQQTLARDEGRKAGEAGARLQIEAMELEKAATARKIEQAEEQRSAAVGQFETLKAEHEKVVADRTTEVRQAMEKNKVEAINAVQAQHVLETQKLSEQLGVLQRRLETEDGEGADVNIFEVLKSKFPKDQVSRLATTSGADILHIVMKNKQECGKILYDSRNRNAWQAGFISKLRDDIVSARADHAILTTNKFPAGFRQIHVVEDVIAANPSRVLAVAEILRAHLVQGHGVRVSEKDRSRKTAKLYEFIASDRFCKLLESLAGNDDKLLHLDEDERRAHMTLWEKRGRLVKLSQKLHGNLRDEIDRILGTAETD